MSNRRACSLEIYIRRLKVRRPFAHTSCESGRYGNVLLFGHRHRGSWIRRVFRWFTCHSTRRWLSHRKLPTVLCFMRCWTRGFSFVVVPFCMWGVLVEGEVFVFTFLWKTLTIAFRNSWRMLKILHGLHIDAWLAIPSRSCNTSLPIHKTFI